MAYADVIAAEASGMGGYMDDAFWSSIFPGDGRVRKYCWCGCLAERKTLSRCWSWSEGVSGETGAR